MLIYILILFLKGGNGVKKKIVLASLIVLVAGFTIAGIATKISANNSKELKEIYQQEIVPNETITCEQENEYVELNNELIQAMNDIEAGKISQEEYEQICKKIYSKVNNKQKEKNIKEQEKAFHESEE